MMQSVQTTVKQLGIQNGLINELLKTTENIYEALSGQDLEVFSRELDRRQGLFVRIREIQGIVEPLLLKWRKECRMPAEADELISRSRITLQRILEIDKDCGKMGDAYKKAVASGLGETRAARKISREYSDVQSKRKSRFMDGSA